MTKRPNNGDPSDDEAKRFKLWRDSFRIDREEKDEKKDDRTRDYLLHNRTPDELVISTPLGDDGPQLHLAPLGERIVSAERLGPLQEEMIPYRQGHKLRVRPYCKPTISPVTPTMQATVGGVLVAIVLVVVLFSGTSLVTGLPIASLTVGGLLVATAWSRADRAERKRQKNEWIYDREEGDIIYRSGGEFYYGNEFNRRFWQFGVFLVIIVIGAVLPAIAMFYGTDLQDHVEFDGQVQIDSQQAGRVLSRIIQIIYLAVLALFPALMFFQFDRLRVGTIRGRWVRSIFALDCQVKTLAQLHARYGDELAEASHYSTDTVRFLGGRRSPLIVATLLITLGWLLLIVRTESFDFSKFTVAESRAEVAEEREDDVEQLVEEAMEATGPEAEAAAAAAQSEVAAAVGAGKQAQDGGGTDVAGNDGRDDGGTTPTTIDPAEQPEQAANEALTTVRQITDTAEEKRDAISSTSFFQLLNRNPSAAGMAFLGAYFYAVYLVLRGYFRGDLRPKVYNQITARLVVIVVVAYLLAVTRPDELPERALWIVAFLAGIVPRQVIRWLMETLPPFIGRNIPEFLGGKKVLGDRLPLTEIQGIDLWERDRLATEGINDLGAMAHGNIVDTMVRARLDIERLVDWVDQAILLLHLEHGQRDNPVVMELRKIGVRRATALVATAGATGSVAREVESIVGKERLALLTAAIKREPNYRVLLHWYDSPLGGALSGCASASDSES